MKTSPRNIDPLALALAALMFNLTVVQHANGGSFLPASPLTSQRYSHTATLLLNGKVLVAGGYNFGALSSAELYDPATGKWTATGAMNTYRQVHTATLLPNGKVLVAGGYNGGYLSSAELYDLTTGKWTATGAMNTARELHTATLLPNGKVLVAGGHNDGNPNGGYPASAELYDPATGTWIAAGAMNTPRDYHTATLLPNGKVLVAGGHNGSGGGLDLATAEVYDPAVGTWMATGAMNTARGYHTTALLPNGKVLVAGGYNGSSLSSAELYDPATGMWTASGMMNTARDSHTATSLPNGNVLVAGGANSYPDFFGSPVSDPLSNAEMYDPVTGTWTATSALNTARQRHTATLLPNGKVLVAGGYDGRSLSNADLYDATATTWTATGALNTARNNHTATLLPNGKVLVAGGHNQNSNGGYPVNAELYDPATRTWTTTGAMNFARTWHSAILLPNGKVLVAGGYNGSDLASSELYDPATEKWTGTGAMLGPSSANTAILLLNGKVLIAARAQLYDSATGTWTATGSMINSRSHVYTVTLLRNGKVLVAGGSIFSPQAELYDPATGMWTSTGSMTTRRRQHTATLLLNGNVLVAGGYAEGSTRSSAELYDPVTESWTLTAAMNTQREDHTAILLPNGKVLVAGGAGGLSSADLYDPASGTWTAAGALINGRDSHTATLLPDGKVLVAGGERRTISSYSLSSAELYVSVNETNSAPTLTVPATQTISELAPLTVTNRAADADISANALTFSLVSAPAGVSINPVSGVLTWTPTEVQGPSTNLITVKVTDNGVPPLSDTKSFTVIVNEVNSAPALTVPSTQTINKSATLTVTNNAVDADIPANALVFSLVSAPAGVSINPASGVLTWTPTEAQGLSTNLITVKVTDSGVPPLSDTKSFTVIVNGVKAGSINGDVNGDGTADILFQDADGFLAAWFMNGEKQKSGSVLTPQNVGDKNYRIVGGGDFNGDGKVDLIFQHADGTLAAWFMDGVSLKSASFLNPNNPGDRNWRVVAVGDFNKDGKRDLLFQHTDGTLAVWFMDTDATLAVWLTDGIKLTSAALIDPRNPGNGWRVAGTGDFDGDGNNDLIFQHTDGTLAAWLLNGTKLISAKLINPNNPGSAQWRVVSTVDRNQDGKPDLLFQHEDGTLAVWFMDGTKMTSATLLNPSKPGGTWKVVAPK